jgi:exodeoxyribonuclease VII large subunit
VVRGGGSQADLAAFDSERVARAIATSPKPVLTGVGHTGDVSVADLVASRSCRTPTACGEAIAAIVREWYAEHVGAPAVALGGVVEGVLDELDDTLAQARRHLVVLGRHRLERAGAVPSSAAARLARRAPAALDLASRRVAATARRLGPLAIRCTSGVEDQLVARRAVLAAHDPARLFAKGWSLTTDASGRAVRSVAALGPGDVLVTRVADGVARSSVTDVIHGAG